MIPRGGNAEGSFWFSHAVDVIVLSRYFSTDFRFGQVHANPIDRRRLEGPPRCCWRVSASARTGGQSQTTGNAHTDPCQPVSNFIHYLHGTHSRETLGDYRTGLAHAKRRERVWSPPRGMALPRASYRSGTAQAPPLPPCVRRAPRTCACSAWFSAISRRASSNSASLPRRR